MPSRLEVLTAGLSQQTITGMLDAIDEMLRLKLARVGRLDRLGGSVRPPGVPGVGPPFGQMGPPGRALVALVGLL
jgi:hypothetical protein